MVKCKTVQRLLVLMALWGSFSGAQARDLLQNAKFDVFVLAGGSTLVDAQYFTSGSALFHSRFELGPKYTFGVSVPYGKLLNIESAFTYGPNNFVVTNTDLNPRVNINYPTRVYIGNLGAEVRAPFSRFRIRPYAAGGIEYDRFGPTPAAVKTATDLGFGAFSTAPYFTHNSKFGVYIGGGLDRRITKRISFRIDLRDHVTSSPAFGMPPQIGFGSTTGGPTYRVKGRANNIVYTAGFVFHLGKL